MRAEALRSTILEVRTAGFVSGKAIARELNARGIPTAAGSKWHQPLLRDCWSALTGSIVSRAAEIDARAVFLPVESILAVSLVKGARP
jgi:hypothetical protein